MQDGCKISVFTQVYNAEKYLEQCISSVLSQTHQNFEYFIVENGSTDNCREIIEKYAAKDSRIRAWYFSENWNGFPYHRLGITAKYATGEYHAFLDADDWWEPDYLERLVSFAHKYDLDIAATGTCMYDMATGKESVRQISQQLIAEKGQYANYFPHYHVFFRVVWDKLIRMEIVKKVDSDILESAANGTFRKLIYGSDTYFSFRALRCAKRIGVDNSLLHHYRMHKKSVSYHYDPARFDADVYLYNDALDFLAPYGPVSRRNREFLADVFANAVTDTLGVVHNADIPAGDKLAEYRRIAEHPITQDVYRVKHEHEERSRTLLFRATAHAAGRAGGEDACAAIRALSPNCGPALTPDTWGVFVREPELLSALERDDAGALLEGILGLIEQGKFAKQHDLGAMAEALIPEDSPLKGMRDALFYKKYMQPCKMMIEGRFGDALDFMTDWLLDGKNLYAGERFLRLYLMLAALTEVAPAYLFGNIRLAELYLNEGRREECAAVLVDLEEMDAGEHEEVKEIRRRLESEK